MSGTKPLWKSKTFWVAILTIAAGVIEYVNGQLVSGAALTIVGILNVLLRLVTTQAVKVLD